MTKFNDKLAEMFRNDMNILNGATVAGVSTFEEYGEVWQCLLFRLEDGRLVQVTVSQDDEGNGPGRLFIGDSFEDKR